MTKGYEQYHRVDFATMNKDANKGSKLLIEYRAAESEYNDLNKAYEGLDALINGFDTCVNLKDYCDKDERETLDNAVRILEKIRGEAYATALRKATKLSRTK